MVFTVRKRSFGKVMFLHLSVILFTGGLSVSVHAGIHPPGRHQTPLLADTPHPGKHPPGQTPPCPVHAGIHTPCPVHAGINMATAADGTHPTGMHSCHNFVYFKMFLKLKLEKY